jgi:hypothetical protein
MSDSALLTSKLAAVGAAITDYIDNLPDVTYLGIHVKISDHVTPDQITELSACVVDAVDTAEDQWTASHPGGAPHKDA